MSMLEPVVLTDLTGKSIIIQPKSDLRDYAEIYATWENIKVSLGGDATSIVAPRFKAGILSFLVTHDDPHVEKGKDLGRNLKDDEWHYSLLDQSEYANFINLMGPHSCWYVEKRRTAIGSIIVIVGPNCDLRLDFRIDFYLAEEWLSRLQSLETTA